jgi:hypothetical protein
METSSPTAVPWLRRFPARCTLLASSIAVFIWLMMVAAGWPEAACEGPGLGVEA